MASRARFVPLWRQWWRYFAFKICRLLTTLQFPYFITKFGGTTSTLTSGTIFPIQTQVNYCRPMAYYLYSTAPPTVYAPSYAYNDTHFWMFGGRNIEGANGGLWQYETATGIWTLLNESPEYCKIILAGISINLFLLQELPNSSGNRRTKFRAWRAI